MDSSHRIKGLKAAPSSRILEEQNTLAIETTIYLNRRSITGEQFLSGIAAKFDILPTLILSKLDCCPRH
jgi:hypothetical protein